jgi:hypothetical protein
VDSEGVFTAAGITENSGKLKVTCGGFSAELNVTVSTDPVLALDFETQKTYASGTGISLATQSDRQYVRYGGLVGEAFLRFLKIGRDHTGCRHEIYV